MRVKNQLWIISLAILFGTLALTHYAGVRNLLTSTLDLVLLLPAANQGAERAADSSEPTSVITSSARVPAFSHIFIIVLENKEAETIVGQPEASYLNSLAAQYARASNFYGIQHPSLPNYLALTGGDTFGVSTNCKDCFIEADNLVNQLETAGRSWKAYMESMPGPCFVGDAPPFYRQKHNPFIYYNNVRTDPARCQKIVPFDQFAGDLKANTLPDFVWITPNMCHDMHDCAVGDGDKWLQTWVPQILASPAWQENGVLFITFDEGKTKESCCTYAAGGKIDTLVVSPLVQPGFTSDVPYNHYSLLGTIELAWGLPLLGKANCDCSPPMSDFFTPPAADNPS
jgi:phosphatidylinositol-3-phosphatase